ncbi:transcription-silencing protein Clr2-domain-containing protein [Podospora conica]|nr:transcription-silencing protein Clr2-domain-containing protein [Schizothecium conicum]
MSNFAPGDDYYPLTIARSDGKGWPRLNYEPINLNEDKDIEQKERWEVIIAGHLAQQLFPKTETRQFKLSDFPKGYELRCATRKEGVRDYFLYGHPAGTNALYRTPGEFVLHALWLLSKSTDYSDCSCDLCLKMVESRSKLVQPFPAADPGVSAQAPKPGPNPKPAKEQPAPGLPPPAKLAKPSQAQVSKQGPAAKQQVAPQVQTTQGPTYPQAAPSVPNTPPGTTGLSNVFRVGELVWYKQQAWRLGLILSTVTKPNVQPPYDDNSYTFIIAPLGHSILNLKPVQKEAIDMRPFLTFSVPAVAIPELSSKTFESVDWQAFAIRYAQDPDQQKRSLKLQMVGLEASKMAARGINDMFSTFNKLGEALTPDRAVRVTHYTGVYLGAEMVRIGDPVRVSAPNGAQEAPDAAPCVMLVSKVQVFTSAWADAATPARVQLRGDVYRVVRAALPHHPQMIVPAEQLGQAFVEEVAMRNAIEREPGTMGWGWNLVQRDAVRPDGDVRGRFYVTFKLMSLIDPKMLEDYRSKGAVLEAQKYLNNRGHSGLGGAHGARRESRAATLGKAVSTQFVVPNGMVED